METPRTHRPDVARVHVALAPVRKRQIRLRIGHSLTHFLQLWKHYDSFPLCLQAFSQCRVTIDRRRQRAAESAGHQNLGSLLDRALRIFVQLSCLLPSKRGQPRIGN